MHQSDVGYITALANDVGAEVIFLRQLIAQARPEDIAAGISTSGGSKISSWRSKRRKRSMLTVAFLGYDGGEILRRGLADRPLIVRSDYIPRIQEVQASIYHTVRELRRLAAMPKTELFGTSSCQYTQEMREWLEWQGRGFIEYDVERDCEALGRMHAATGGQITVPVLLEDGKVSQIGWHGRGCVVSRGHQK